MECHLGDNRLLYFPITCVSVVAFDSSNVTDRHIMAGANDNVLKQNYYLTVYDGLYSL